MPSNLLVLPLLAGFWFITHSHRYRFRVLSWDGYRLLLESAAMGFLFFTLARAVILGFEMWPHAVDLIKQDWLPISGNIGYLGSAIASFILAMMFSFLDNRGLPKGSRDIVKTFRTLRKNEHHLGIRTALLLCFRHNYTVNQDRQLSDAVELYGSPLARLLYTAVRNGTPVSITLSNRKWYVGYVSQSVSLDPKYGTHFRITPLFSGYRDKDTLSAIPTLSYRELYTHLKDSGSTIQPNFFDVTIPVADVDVANYFNQEFYDMHFVARRVEVCS